MKIMKHFLLLLSAVFLSVEAHAQCPAKPNFVILLADDLGWQDVGCYDVDANAVYETPYMDGLAATGVQFMQGYSPTPVCGPSRYGILSGRFPIFEIIENDNSRYLTQNPYANDIVKPYDGTIAGLRLLGFAMPSAGSSGTYGALSGFLPAENYFADGETLFARTASSIETQRVEHFGFTDDSGDGANTANPDGDMANNLYEYGFGGNPTNPADIGYLPTSGTVVESSTNFFEYVYARRIGSGGELSYTVESSPNLLSNIWNMAEYTELPIAGPLDADYEAVTNRIDTAGKTNEFIRLKVDALQSRSSPLNYEDFPLRLCSPVGV